MPSTSDHAVYASRHLAAFIFWMASLTVYLVYGSWTTLFHDPHNRHGFETGALGLAIVSLFGLIASTTNLVSYCMIIFSIAKVHLDTRVGFYALSACSGLCSIAAYHFLFRFGEDAVAPSATAVFPWIALHLLASVLGTVSSVSILLAVWYHLGLISFVDATEQ